jgi:hypothetical protein
VFGRRRGGRTGAKRGLDGPNSNQEMHEIVANPNWEGRGTPHQSGFMGA